MDAIPYPILSGGLVLLQFVEKTVERYDYGSIVTSYMANCLSQAVGDNLTLRFTRFPYKWRAKHQLSMRQRTSGRVEQVAVFLFPPAIVKVLYGE